MTPVEMIAEGHRLITEGLALLSKPPLTLVPSEAVRELATGSRT